jgi:hypothetical protein
LEQCRLADADQLDSGRCAARVVRAKLSTCPNDTVNGPGDCDSMAGFVAFPKDVLKLSFLSLKSNASDHLRACICSRVIRKGTFLRSEGSCIVDRTSLQTPHCTNKSSNKPGERQYSHKAAFSLLTPHQQLPRAAPCNATRTPCGHHGTRNGDHHHRHPRHTFATVRRRERGHTRRRARAVRAQIAACRAHKSSGERQYSKKTVAKTHNPTKTQCE